MRAQLQVSLFPNLNSDPPGLAHSPPYLAQIILPHRAQHDLINEDCAKEGDRHLCHQGGGWDEPLLPDLPGYPLLKTPHPQLLALPQVFLKEQPRRSLNNLLSISLPQLSKNIRLLCRPSVASSGLNGGSPSRGEHGGLLLSGPRTGSLRPYYPHQPPIFVQYLRPQTLTSDPC